MHIPFLPTLYTVLQARIGVAECLFHLLLYSLCWLEHFGKSGCHMPFPTCCESNVEIFRASALSDQPSYPYNTRIGTYQLLEQPSSHHLKIISRSPATVVLLHCSALIQLFITLQYLPWRQRSHMTRQIFSKLPNIILSSYSYLQ